MFGALIRQWSHVLSIAAGIGIIVMGSHFLGPLRIAAMHARKAIEIARPPGLWSAYLMGLAFAFGWTPCIGPILATILAVAGSQETATRGAMLLAVYSLRAGRAVRARRDGDGAVPGDAPGASAASSASLEKLVGALLVLTGVGFLTGGLQAASLADRDVSGARALYAKRRSKLRAVAD